eukprot:COSAG02_NODE_9158_length_2306_cov_2.458088_3_plen_388_part_00
MAGGSSLSTPVKPPSILIPPGDRAGPGREVWTGRQGSTPKEVKEVVLTPAEIRKQRTFKKRRRPRADRHRGRNPRNRGWKQRRPPPVEPATVLARSHAQIKDLAESLAEPCQGPGVSRRALALVDVCVRAAAAAVDERTADSRTTSAQERAGRYATAAAATAADAAARPNVNRNGFILPGTDTRGARGAPEERFSRGQVASLVSAGTPGERAVRLTKAGEAVLSDFPTGAVGLSAAEIAELAAMQGLMMDRHCASQWQLSDEEEQQEESHEAVEVQWQLSDDEEQQEDVHEAASIASSSDSSDLDSELLPAEMTPEARAAAMAGQDERMVRHGRLQNLIHASGGLSAIRPDVSIGTKEVAEWSDFMEQGLASVEEAIASLSFKSPPR